MNLKDKIAQAGQARHLVDTPARRKTYFVSVLFLALLIPVVVGKLAAAEDQPNADSALVVDVYSGGRARCNPGEGLLALA
jgi:hypothetical protein